MRMVPQSPFDTGSQAEKLIFDRLRRAFDERWVAYHSLRPTRHPRKRFPEIDFLVCGPDGLFVIEVKGGRVAYRDGIWRYEDRHDRTVESQEGPLRQAESALHGLMADLRDHLPAGDLDSLVTGYGVVFPDCQWRTHGAEWDPAMLADRRGSRDMESWLRGLAEYWKARQRTRGQSDAGATRRLHEFLRPEIDSTTEAIIVVDLSVPHESNPESAAHYVAMSRARAVLSLIHRSPD